MANDYLFLELAENGGFKSLIDDKGKIWATGSSSRQLLREAGRAAKPAGFTTIKIGAQRWEIDRILEAD